MGAGVWPCISVRPSDEDVDGGPDGVEVGSGVVLEVAPALDVEQMRFACLKGVRPPVPGAAVEHHGVEWLQAEGPDGSGVVGAGEANGSLGHGEDAGNVEDQQGLGVGVVAEHLRAPRQPVGPRDLVGAVGDDVHMGVGPLELEVVQGVTRIGVGHREPSEGLEGLGPESLGIA